MFDPNLIIKSERLFFRYLKKSDVNKEYKEWLNDKDVNKYLEIRHEQHTILTSKTLFHLKINLQIIIFYNFINKMVYT